MKYANDPYWVRLHWALFILFWIIWVAMLVSSIVIIIYAPKCPSPEPKEWWQKNAMVKVDVKTYSDGKLAGLQDLPHRLQDSGRSARLHGRLESFRERSQGSGPEGRHRLPDQRRLLPGPRPRQQRGGAGAGAGHEVLARHRGQWVRSGGGGGERRAGRVQEAAGRRHGG